MFTLLYEILGGVIFMFYLHLLGFGKENFTSVSKKTIYTNCQKYHLQLSIILILIILLNSMNDDK